MTLRAAVALAAAGVLALGGMCALAEETASPYPEGGAVFQANCAVCHGPKGAGQPSLAPPLTAYPARYAAIPEGRRQLALTVLNGMFGGIDVEGKHFDFKMPEFTQLDDDKLAAALNFVVFGIANAKSDVKPITAAEIAAERAHPMDGTAVREHRVKVLAELGL